MSRPVLDSLRRIDLVMLGAPNLEAAVAFYRDTLGMAVKFRSPGFVFLDAGGITLCLSEPLARASATLVGATELVIRVADVKAAYQALVERGVPFAQAPRPVTPTDWAANFSDPSGH